MRLYAGTSKQFIDDTVQNQISEKLRTAFFDHFRYYPSSGEVNSWRNSLRAISQIFQHANLLDQGIILEYQLPLTSKRLDCLICGRDSANNDNALIIELKQWDKCEKASGENEVLTWVGGGTKEVLHPSVQVGQYQMYLKDTHTAFHEGTSPVVLIACAYLHNYHYDSEDHILSEKFRSALDNWPLFVADDVKKFENYLIPRIGQGNGNDVLQRIEGSKYRPSKKLMEHVEGVIKGKPEYILLDEQKVVYDKVLSCAKEGFHDRLKTVIIVKGGPGTGKSVIAINLMADLLENYNTHYVTGSRAFTETLRRIIGSRGTAQFRYTHSYTEAKENDVDVLIVDEAHRLRKTSRTRFSPKNKRFDVAQIEELINASKVAVLFIDDNQVVRPDEIGSVQYIKEYAQKANCRIFEYELDVQFRCNGSDAFVNWVDNTLGVKRTANVIWDQREQFDFRILGSPGELEDAIREKVQAGQTGRITAGFCWQWSYPNPDGTLKDDIVIGNYRRPWNARPEARRLAAGIPKSNLWAYDRNGINQIGCVYTAQGFEFDYAGVIFGNDLVYDFDQQTWKGQPENSEDAMVRRSRGSFLGLVKNTYRVLLSRGMKGCYVYFTDKDTERFLKSRIESQGS